jgi:hypothetical protein
MVKLPNKQCRKPLRVNNLPVLDISGDKHNVSARYSVSAPTPLAKYSSFRLLLCRTDTCIRWAESDKHMGACQGMEIDGDRDGVRVEVYRVGKGPSSTTIINSWNFQPCPASHLSLSTNTEGAVFSVVVPSSQPTDSIYSGTT